MVFTFAGLRVFLSESGFTGFYDLQDVGCCMGAVVLLSYWVYYLFPVLPVICRCFHAFWHLSS
jgi:hypothetical protein